MADAAVEFLLDNLKQLLLYHGALIGNAKGEVDKLETDLRMFKAFLRDSIKKRRKDETLRELVREIRDVVYEAEDIIDAFVTQATEAKSRNYFLNAFKKPVDLLSIAKDVEALGSKIKAIRGDKSMFDFATQISFTDENEALQDKEEPTVKKVNVVGLEDEAEKIIGYLKEETNQLDAISIIGMPGLGKTTLTGKIFLDLELHYIFPTRIWVYISQEFTRKNVFLEILSKFTGLTDDMYHKTDQELANLVCGHLQTGNFLIVLDDVWTTDDWDKLKIAFPTNINMGKILITSRVEEVGCYANRDRDPHNLRLLTHDEGWLLLQYEVFGKPEYPPELEGPGRLIVDRCGRLPLAIVVIGGILAKKGRGDMTAKRNAWIKVSETVTVLLTSGDTTKRMEKIIALSYDRLPYHLRACFLYLGIFPEDFEIPAWKLTRMWIAEGFIQQKDDTTLQETAESYLDDLINRNLLRVDKMKRDGKVKTCRIHDMLREFCRYESGGERENFLQEVKISTEGKFVPADVRKCRRLCIHPNVLKNFFSSRPYGPCVRSFVCFSEDEVDLPAENISAIPAAFKLLRVLEVKPIKFPKLPSDLYQLVHLRYIVLSFNLAILPPAFSKLWNIQTLIVDTTSRTLDVKADIWKMMHLTHFKTNASAILPKAGKNSKEGDKIRTLSTISPQSCNEKFFDQARNLKKLGIRGRLAAVLDAKTGSFDSVGKLGSLEKLKLMNDVHPSPPSDGQLRGLPSPYQFPPKLKRLTLSKTYLDWTHMTILGLLENLEVLKLKDKAFTGNIWEVVDGGFRHLEFLYVERTDLAYWTASGRHFPRLKSLELKNCEELQEIPFGLSEIPTFQILDLHCTKYAAPSATKILQAKQKKHEEKTGKTNAAGFKLSIFPPYKP